MPDKWIEELFFSDDDARPDHLSQQLIANRLNALISANKLDEIRRIITIIEDLQNTIID